MIWRYIDTGSHPGDWNMAYDERLAREFNPLSDLPIVRVFGWSPFTISIGVNQRLDDFDLDKIEKDRIGIVRRPTGGRAIYHAHELTYSIVLDSGERSARQVYQYLSCGILAGLGILGIRATIAGTDEQLPGVYNNPLSIPCFSTSTRSELQWHGKKLVGSAQRRYGKTILQHGSILLGPEHRRLGEYLSPGNQHMRSLIDEQLAQRTIEAETILGRGVTFEEAARCLRKGFEEAYDISFITENKHQEEQSATESQSIRIV